MPATRARSGRPPATAVRRRPGHRAALTALLVAALTGTAGCTGDGRPAGSATPTGDPSAAPAVKPGPRPPDLPSGLIGLVRGADDLRLRVYDARNGAVLRTLTVPTAGAVVFSPDFAYAAELDSGNLLLYVRSGDAYQPSDRLTAESLHVPGANLVRADFVPRGHLLAVEVDGGDGELRKTVSLDPAEPRSTVRDFAGVPSEWDSSGQPVDDVAHVAVPDRPDVRNAVVRRSGRELVQGHVLAPDGDGDGTSTFRYSCTAGRQIGAFTLACWGVGGQAELVALTADPASDEATIRLIAKRAGEPFTKVLVAPDGKRLLAERADGFYATTVPGGSPKRLFGPLKGGQVRLLTWH